MPGRRLLHLSGRSIMCPPTQAGHPQGMEGFKAGFLPNLGSLENFQTSTTTFTMAGKSTKFSKYSSLSKQRSFTNRHQLEFQGSITLLSDRMLCGFEGKKSLYQKKKKSEEETELIKWSKEMFTNFSKLTQRYFKATVENSKSQSKEVLLQKTFNFFLSCIHTQAT